MLALRRSSAGVFRLNVKSDSAEDAAKWGMPTPFHEMRYDFVLEPDEGDPRPGFSVGSGGD